MSIAEEKVDWKEIRSQWDAVKDAPENEPVSDALERITKREDLLKWHFPSLISALEEQEKALDEFIKAWGIQIEDGYVTDGNGMHVPAGAAPELAKYLEEKNG